MVEDEDWVAKRVNEAHKAHPSLADSAASRILELLKGKVMDRQLSTAELREIAKMLLADIAPLASPKTSVTDAN
jgi:hypothetical protein